MRERKLSYLTVAVKIFGEALRAAPVWIFIDCSAMLLSSVCYAFSTVVKQWLFDTITAVAAGTGTLHRLIAVTVFVVLFMIGNELLNAVCNFTWSPAMKSVVGKLKQKIHQKIARLPGNCFEDLEVLEWVEKANMGADMCYGLYNSVATILLFYAPYFLVLGIYLWRLKPVLLLALPVIFVPLLCNLFIRQKIFGELFEETVPLQREKDYYETELSGREKLKENRLYGSYSFFMKKYVSVNDEFCRKRWRAAKKSELRELALRMFTLAGYLGVVLLLVFFMMNNSISVGAFAAVFSSISTLITFMNDAISNYLSTLFDNMAPLKKYLEFFSLPEDMGESGEACWENEVQVQGVSFSFPNTEKKVLDNISFTIHKGETIALVGENGAGKSTLVRIMAGILKPDEGQILVDGQDIFKLHPAGRFRHTSAVFQNFIRYQMNVRENVEISQETERIQNDLSEKEREVWFEDCIRKSEFSMNKDFKAGFDTMLSVEFGGIDLSGGQWQRLALARGLYRKNKFIVLDEPTSAIDPIEEGILYRRFGEMIADKMGMIVTHRLGSARIADKILVLHEGRLKEQGTHQELVSQGGYYAALYQEQSKWYQE